MLIVSGTNKMQIMSGANKRCTKNNARHNHTQLFRASKIQMFTAFCSHVNAEMSVAVTKSSLSKILPEAYYKLPPLSQYIIETNHIAISKMSQGQHDDRT